MKGKNIDAIILDDILLDTSMNIKKVSKETGIKEHTLIGLKYKNISRLSVDNFIKLLSFYCKLTQEKKGG